MEKAEALGQLRGNETTQRDVIDQHHKADGFTGLIDGHAHWDVIHNHGHLTFHVDPVSSSAMTMGSRGPRKLSEPP